MISNKLFFRVSAQFCKHNPGHRITKVDLIWHHLNIKKNSHFNFFKDMSCYCWLSKLSLNPLNWMIHFGSASTRFNSKLEWDKEMGLQVSRSNYMIRFDDTSKKISIRLIFWFSLKKKNLTNNGTRTNVIITFDLPLYFTKKN
jgi:hypothetical protein